jgi:hypothetical protein
LARSTHKKPAPTEALVIVQTDESFAVPALVSRLLARSPKPKLHRYEDLVEARKEHPQDYILVPVLPATAALALSLAQGSDAETALSQWKVYAKALLKQARRARRKIILFDAAAGNAEPAAMSQVLAKHMNLSLSTPRGRKPQATPLPLSGILQALVAPLLQQDDDALILAEEFDSFLIRLDGSEDTLLPPVAKLAEDYVALNAALSPEAPVADPEALRALAANTSPQKTAPASQTEAERDMLRTENTLLRESIAQQGQAFAQQEQAITQQKQAIAQQGQAITQQKQAIAQQEQAIAQQEQAFAAKVHAITTGQAEEAALMRKSLEYSETEISNLQEQQELLHESLALSSQTIDTLISKETQQAQEIQDMSKERADLMIKAAQAESLQRQLQAARDYGERRNSMLAMALLETNRQGDERIQDLKATEASLWQENETLRAETSEATQELNRIYASRSWKITEPLRKKTKTGLGG